MTNLPYFDKFHYFNLPSLLWHTSLTLTYLPYLDIPSLFGQPSLVQQTILSLTHLHKCDKPFYCIWRGSKNQSDFNLPFGQDWTFKSLILIFVKCQFIYFISLQVSLEKVSTTQKKSAMPEKPKKSCSSTKKVCQFLHHLQYVCLGIIRIYCFHFRVLGLSNFFLVFLVKASASFSGNFLDFADDRGLSWDSNFILKA